MLICVIIINSFLYKNKNIHHQSFLNFEVINFEQVNIYLKYHKNLNAITF